MHTDQAHEIRVDWDEDGCHIIIVGDALDCDFRVSDPEQLYDCVKAAIGPWLYERDEARRTMPLHVVPDDGAYDISDPKHPRFHSVHADLWDARDGK